MSFQKVQYIDGVTTIGAKNLNDIQDAILGTKTTNGTVVSQNADFAEVAEWADGNPTNEDRTGYFVCANVPVDGIVMKKATSTDDVKGVTIQAPAFAGNYTPDKLDSEGNLLPKYSFVAIIGFVPVRDNGTCTVGGRCMPDDNGCAVPSSNSMGYQVVNRIDENRVLIIIEPNGDMVQRIKTKVNEIQEAVKPHYELVYSITLAEDVSKVNNKVEEYLDGTKPVKLIVKLPASSTLSSNLMAVQFSFSNSRNQTVRAINWRSSSMPTSCVWELTKHEGYWWIEVNPYDKEVTTTEGDLQIVTNDKIRYINITTAVPAGTTIEIWGAPK